ncbi:phosphomethylpyrimidine synthase ThiC, partial [Aliarcobacter butzleri]|uniref:phosphomethylpyrimidine synthase ThiC n=1 Tax=Aliarcobacter butzleri TaxID=28197 RepID=UPI003AF5F881
AQVENLDPALVRAEIERGRFIIPALVNHIHLAPMSIGLASSCKMYAKVGASARARDGSKEIEKVDVCLKSGAETIMEF